MGQGNIKWTLMNKNKCFRRLQDISNTTLQWPGCLPSDACTGSRWQHYLLELDLFLCVETTYKEPGTGNSYWVLSDFPGHRARQEWNKSWKPYQGNSVFRVCIAAFLLLWKIPRSESRRQLSRQRCFLQSPTTWVRSLEPTGWKTHLVEV